VPAEPVPELRMQDRQTLWSESLSLSNWLRIAGPHERDRPAVISRLAAIDELLTEPMRG